METLRWTRLWRVERETEQERPSQKEMEQGWDGRQWVEVNCVHTLALEEAGKMPPLSPDDVPSFALHVQTWKRRRGTEKKRKCGEEIRGLGLQGGKRTSRGEHLIYLFIPFLSTYQVG